MMAHSTNASCNTTTEIHFTCRQTHADQHVLQPVAVPWPSLACSPGCSPGQHQGNNKTPSTIPGIGSRSCFQKPLCKIEDCSEVLKAGKRGFQEVENQLVVGLASCLLSWRRADVCKFVTAGMGIELIPVHQVKIDSFSFCTCRLAEQSLKMASNLLQHMRCVYQAQLLACASCDLDVSTVPLGLQGRLDHIRQTGT